MCDAFQIFDTSEVAETTLSKNNSGVMSSSEVLMNDTESDPLIDADVWDLAVVSPNPSLLKSPHHSIADETSPGTFGIEQAQPPAQL